MPEVTQAFESAKSAHKRIDKVEKEVSDLRALTMSIARMDQSLTHLKEDVGKIKEKVDEINELPKIRWNSLVQAITVAIASGLIGALLTALLK